MHSSCDVSLCVAVFRGTSVWMSCLQDGVHNQRQHASTYAHPREGSVKHNTSRTPRQSSVTDGLSKFMQSTRQETTCCQSQQQQRFQWMVVERLGWYKRISTEAAAWFSSEEDLWWCHRSSTKQSWNIVVRWTTASIIVTARKFSLSTWCFPGTDELLGPELN